MKQVYISVGLRDSREQELVARPSTRDGIIRGTVQAIHDCSATPTGILSTLAIEMPGGIDLPKHLWTHCVDDRKVTEITTIADSDKQRVFQPDEWVIVVRPFQGIVGASRLESFINKLDKLPEDCSVAVSTLPLPATANPFWNTFYFDLEQLSSSGWRMPPRDYWQCDNIKKYFPDLKKAIPELGAKGTQHLPEMFIDDEGLYAFRASLLQDRDNLVVPDSRPVSCTSGDSLTEKMYCDSAPLFFLDKHREFDLSSFGFLEGPTK